MSEQKFELSTSFLLKDNMQDILWDFGPGYVLACLWAKALLLRRENGLSVNDIARIANNCRVDEVLLDIALGICDFFEQDGKYYYLKDDNQQEIEDLKALPYSEYLKSDYWKRVSYMVKKEAGFKCSQCGSMKRLEVHHLSYENKGDEMNHLEDLVCLCHNCHSKEHGYEEK